MVPSSWWDHFHLWSRPKSMCERRASNIKSLLTFKSQTLMMVSAIVQHKSISQLWHIIQGINSNIKLYYSVHLRHDCFGLAEAKTFSNQINWILSKFSYRISLVWLVKRFGVKTHHQMKASSLVRTSIIIARIKTHIRTRSQWTLCARQISSICVWFEPMFHYLLSINVW